MLCSSMCVFVVSFILIKLAIVVNRVCVMFGCYSWFFSVLLFSAVLNGSLLFGFVCTLYK